MGCIRNQPGKGLPDARGLFAVRAGQPAGEERKSCHCQGPGRGEDKAVPAGGEQGNAHSACGGEHSRQAGPAPVRMTQGSQQDSDGGAHSTDQHKGLSSRNICGAAGFCRLFRSRRFRLFRGPRDSGGIRFRCCLRSRGDRILRRQFCRLRRLSHSRGRGVRTVV